MDDSKNGNIFPSPINERSPLTFKRNSSHNQNIKDLNYMNPTNSQIQSDGYAAVPRSSIDSIVNVTNPFIVDNAFENLSDDSDSNTINTNNPLYQDSENTSNNQDVLKYKIFALICTLLISVGSHYSAHTLGAMKSIIKKELGITNSQYGVLQSTVSLVNTIIPVFGGFFIDSFGTAKGSLLATFFIMIGSLIIAFSTNISSFSTMVLGRIIYGLGSGTIVTVQETILGHWFRGSSLAAAIALQISTARLSSFLSMGTAVPIMNLSGFYGAAFWAASFFCVLSFIVNFFYYSKMTSISKTTDVHSLQKLISKNDFNLSYLTRFSGLFWLIILSSFILGSSWNSFLHMNSEFIKIKFGVSDGIAAWNASFSQLLPVFLVPFCGVFIDRYGLRTKFIILSSAFFILAIATLGYTQINPIIGMLIFSLSLTLGPVSLISSATLVLGSNVLGTGLGLYKSALNVGSTLVDILIGYLQDSSSKNPSLSDYDLVIKFYLFWGLFSLILGVAIFTIDKTNFYSLLSSNSEDRKASIDILASSNVSERKKTLYLYISSFSVTIWVILLLLSWLVFAAYLI
ncbi:Major facilitator superfamily domain-containing protein 1 [Smittium culicis]|uniref:Lysosomal dipeptide transporter MFSD1 n=1 Tax=Smittium culicis TaxID=133412 RepID=A0A1R1YHX2_9FUNG|nr:Major facilitator superfamily domain-containing protein 1 [Smittium culicis]